MHDYAVKKCWRVKEELAAYDATWGPSSAHGRAVHAAQGFAPMSLLDVYIKGRSQLRAPVGAAFVAPSCSANVHSLSPRACLAVLDEAIKVAAVGCFHGYAPEPRGLRPQACAQVHCVMDAVHNIPTALVEPGNTWWTAHRLREVFAAYDRAWGPGSAFAQQYSEHFIRPVSLLQTYDEADRCDQDVERGDQRGDVMRSRYGRTLEELVALVRSPGVFDGSNTKGRQPTSIRLAPTTRHFLEN